MKGELKDYRRRGQQDKNRGENLMKGELKDKAIRWRSRVSSANLMKGELKVEAHCVPRNSQRSRNLMKGELKAAKELGK